MRFFSLTSPSLGLPALAVLAAMIMPAASADAGTIIYSPTEPIFDANDIIQLATGAFATAPESYNGNINNDNANYIASDRPAQGQTFTATDVGQIESITVKSAGGFVNIPGGTQLTLRINTVVGTTLTPIYTDVAVLPESPESSNGLSDYVTFTLATPLAVGSGVTYGFDFGNTAGNPGFYFRIDGAADTSYSGGTAYSTGVRDGFGTTTAIFRQTDRTFGIGFSPVPEPTVALLSLMSGAAMMVMRRNRRG